MSEILFVHSSVRGSASASRSLAGFFKNELAKQHSGARIQELDLAEQPLHPLDATLVGGLFAAPDAQTAEQKKLLAISDRLIDDLFATDTLVISAGMYNFAVPSGLKTYIDYICRAGRTFKYTASGPQGLVTGKKAILILASGGVYSEGPAASMEYFGSYLKTVLGFIGITDVTIVRAEGLALGQDEAAKSVAKAQDALSAIAAA